MCCNEFSNMNVQMNVGNQFVNKNWKSSLSRLARQVFLMQSELSTALKEW